MKIITQLFVILVLITIALASGYWWGNSNLTDAVTKSPDALITENKILYYRNPMGHPDISPIPKKDAMGMDYLPVYADEALLADNSVVQISTDKVQKLGVRTADATLRTLTHTVRAVATVQVSERGLYTITPKFEGWIQRLYVNTTGQRVKKGEMLMDIYSPELITAQHEYLIAIKGMHWVEESDPAVQARMQRLSEKALNRLRNWDIAEIDLRALQQEGKIIPYLTLRSPADGVVIEKLAVQGKRFMPGEVLYQIADLSLIWVLADVFEQDLALVHLGQATLIKFDAYPDKIFNGKITFIYPTVSAETRTTKVRIELPNNQELLKPAMYGSVEFSSPLSDNKMLAIPNSAVLDTGTRQLVLVALGEGRFEPRTVKLGRQADGYTEVLDGLEAGATVVISANFLLDAESNFKAALGSFGHPNAVSQSNDNEISLDISEPARHRGEGSIESIDWTQATVTITHGPITSLKWPAMTMDFRVLDPALLHALKPGQMIDFDIVAAASGKYIIARIYPPGNSGTNNGHDGH